MVVVNTGATDSLIVEWTGGPTTDEGVWQYQAWPLKWFGHVQSASEPAEWTDIPASDADLRRHLITGLRAGTDYLIILRFIGERVTVDEFGWGGSRVRGPDEAPLAAPGMIAVGDGRTQWRVGPSTGSAFFLVTIPDGMRVWVQTGPGSTGIYLVDLHTGSRLVTSRSGDVLEALIRSDPRGHIDQLVASIMENLVLTVVSDGTPGDLDIEWTGGPANATRWQYRTQVSYFPAHWSFGSSPWDEYRVMRPWGRWIDIPDSGPDTRHHRLRGLWQEMRYEVQVRALVEDLPTYSQMETGFVQPGGDLPSLFPWSVAQGDGVTQWRIGGTESVIVIPEGKRLWLGGWNGSDVIMDRTRDSVTIYEHETWSELDFVYDPEGGSGALLDYPRINSEPGTRKTKELLDLFADIKASLDTVPSPRK